MLRTKHLLCPDCNGIFGFQAHLTDEPLPNYCPLCGNRMSGEPESVFVPQAPFIGGVKSIGKTADALYRQHEEAGAAHAHLAAELGGGEAKDYSALRVTDMADRLRAGDMAAKIAPNPVSTFMASSGQGGFKPAGGLSGAQFAQNTGQGAFPHAGEAARRNLVAEHQTRSRAVEAFGRISRYRG